MTMQNDVGDERERFQVPTAVFEAAIQAYAAAHRNGSCPDHCVAMAVETVWQAAKSSIAPVDGEVVSWLRKMDKSLDDAAFEKAMEACGYPMDDKFASTYRLVIGAYLEAALSSLPPQSAQKVSVEDLRATLLEAAMCGTGWEESAVELVDKFLLPAVASLPLQSAPVEGWRDISSAPQSKAVLIYYKNSLGKSRVIKAIFHPRFTQETNADNDCFEYSEEKDCYYTPEGWYELIDNWDDFSSVHVNGIPPTHWQPLPLPPNHAAPAKGMAI